VFASSAEEDSNPRHADYDRARSVLLHPGVAATADAIVKQTDVGIQREARRMMAEPAADVAAGCKEREAQVWRNVWNPIQGTPAPVRGLQHPPA
jgi:hypothetical protein